jgi:hypothetical protein
VQRDLDDLHSALSHSIKQFGGEVQPGGRSGYGSALASVYGLIPLAVEPLFSVALDVRRKRRAAYPVYDLIEITVRFKSNYAATPLAPLDDLGGQRAWRKLYARAGHHRFAGSNKRFPHERFFPADEKDFNTPARPCLASRRLEPPAQQPSRKDPCIVYNQHIASGEIIRQPLEGRIS